MLYLACSHDLASLETTFQSMFHACILAFSIPFMLWRVDGLCSMFRPLCMHACKCVFMLLLHHFGHCFGPSWELPTSVQDYPSMLLHACLVCCYTLGLWHVVACYTCLYVLMLSLLTCCCMFKWYCIWHASCVKLLSMFAWVCPSHVTCLPNHEYCHMPCMFAY